MFDLREEQERVILVGVQENGGANAEESLDELAELASTAGAKVEGRLVQVREAIHPGTYIGKGIENSGARLRCDGHHLRR